MNKEEKTGRKNKEESGGKKLVDLMHMAVVYGPPEFIRKKIDQAGKKDQDDPQTYPDIHARPSKDGTDPDDPAINTLYGPPEMLEGPDDPAMTEVYGPPEMFDNPDDLIKNLIE